ncbi:MAG TPA: hypothetical protein VGK48_11525 [Terriglobia bacterium]|jgi:hypothetical protein
MQKRISKKRAIKKRAIRKDSNQIAFAAVQRTAELSEAEPPVKFDKATISEVMKQLGAKGGRIGGKRRMETMSDSERRERATQAARARWDKSRH